MGTGQGPHGQALVSVSWTRAWTWVRDTLFPGSSGKVKADICLQSAAGFTSSPSWLALPHLSPKESKAAENDISSTALKEETRAANKRCEGKTGAGLLNACFLMA